MGLILITYVPPGKMPHCVNERGIWWFSWLRETKEVLKGKMLMWNLVAVGNGKKMKMLTYILYNMCLFVGDKFFRIGIRALVQVQWTIFLYISPVLSNESLGGGFKMFQIFFDFHPEIWGRFPFWLRFFRWVETTNQITNLKAVVFFFRGDNLEKKTLTFGYIESIRRWGFSIVTAFRPPKTLR